MFYRTVCYLFSSSFVASCFIPNVTTSYEYLGIRFGKAMQTIGSMSYILFYCVAIVLYLPIVILTSVFDINHTSYYS